MILVVFLDTYVRLNSMVLLDSVSYFEYLKDLAIQDVCAHHPGMVFPHPDQCQLYYNCSHTAQPNRRLKLHQQECPYPMLFDVHTQTCRSFKYVQCGGRTEVKHPCKYDFGIVSISRSYRDHIPL